jgi:hypothetical protein
LAALQRDGISVFLDRRRLVLLGVELDECETLSASVIDLDDPDRLRVILGEDGLDVVVCRALWNSPHVGRVPFALAGRPRRSDNDAAAVDLDRLPAGESGLRCGGSFEIDEPTPAGDERAPEVGSGQYMHLFDCAKLLKESSKVLQLRRVFHVAQMDLEVAAVLRHDVDWPDEPSPQIQMAFRTVEFCSDSRWPQERCNATHRHSS